MILHRTLFTSEQAAIEYNELNQNSTHSAYADNKQAAIELNELSFDSTYCVR
jgi:hypothetical protein